MAGEEDSDGVAAITTIIAALKPLEAKTRMNVIEFVLKQLAINLSLPSDAGGTTSQTIFEAPTLAAQSEVADIRSLADEKQPKTVNEKVALVAYYLRNLAPADQRRDYINAADIEPYFTEAGFLHPTGPANMTLANAKNAGYLNALGSGQYRLNPVGHNLVAHRLREAKRGPKGFLSRTRERNLRRRGGNVRLRFLEGVWRGSG